MPGAAPEVSERPERFSDAATFWVFLVGLWRSNHREHAEKPRDSGEPGNPPKKIQAEKSTLGYFSWLFFLDGLRLDRPYFIVSVLFRILGYC